MPNYPYYLVESIAGQYRQDRMREASAERALRAMRREANEQADEQAQPAAARPRPARLRSAWYTLAQRLAALL